MEEKFARALAQGHLIYYPSTVHRLLCHDLPFEIRLCPVLLQKPARDGRNPFQPYDEGLWVDNLPHDHVVLLNKFCLVSHHLLIIPRQFESQTDPLKPQHFEVMAEAIARYFPNGNYLAFYNGGSASGASQPHRHFQLIPKSQPCLVDVALESEIELPFKHSLKRCTRFNWYETYQSISIIGDFSLLFTDSWMMLVPRPTGKSNPWSLNSLAFAGYLLAKDETQMEAMMSKDLIQVLVELTQ